jgi:RNA polymerase sigma-70 factor (ECF subfamily)
MAGARRIQHERGANVSDEATGDLDRIYIDAFRLGCRTAARTVDRDVAKDLAQGVAVRLVNQCRAHPARFESAADRKAWILTATRNAVRDYLKVSRHREERQFAYLFDVDLQQTDDDEPDRYAWTPEVGRVIGRTLLRMPEARRECFLRSQDDGATYEEIATERGISIKAVGHHIANARKGLAKAVLDHHEEGS